MVIASFFILKGFEVIEWIGCCVYIQNFYIQQSPWSPNTIHNFDYSCFHVVYVSFPNY
jgi:hypothetical protein